MGIIPDAFNDIPEVPISEAKNIYGMDYLDKLSAIQIGNGSNVLRGDESGFWLGAAKFADAPFSVSMAGAVIASSATFSAYATTAAALLKAGSAQTLTGDFNLNDGNVKIDGANKRIIINDGTNDRILIGYQASGF